NLQELHLHEFSRLRIERGERLVQQQKLRIGRERAGDVDALAHAAAKLMRIMLGEAGKTDELDERSGAAAGVVLGRAALELEPIADVALDRVPGEERVLLEHHGAIGTGRSDQLAVDADFAAVGFGQTVDSIQEGRLAAAAGADDGNELAFEDG